MPLSSFRRLTPAARCTLALGLLGIAAAGWAGWRRIADAREARALWALLDSGGGDSRQGAAALWDLSEASPGVKREILAASLRRWPAAGRGNVIHAAVGLHPAGLALLLDIFHSECGASSLGEWSSRRACVSLSEELPQRIRGEYLVQAIAASSTPSEIRFLAEPLRGTGTDTTQARQQIARLLVQCSPEDSLPLLGALDALGGELPPREAEQALDSLSFSGDRRPYEKSEVQLLRRLSLRAGPAAARARARWLALLRSDPSNPQILLQIPVLQALGQEQLLPADADLIASRALARFRAAGFHDFWDAFKTVDRTFRALHRDIPVETLEGAARAVFLHVDQPGVDCPTELESWRPIWAKLPPAVAEELRGETLRRLLAAEDPPVAFCLGAALADWDDLPPGDAAIAWRRLFGLANFRIRPGWVKTRKSWVPFQGLAGIATRLAPDDAARAWMMIVGSPERRDSVSRWMLASSLSSLARNLPPTFVTAAGDALLPIREPGAGLLDDLNHDNDDLFQAAAALGPRLPAATRHKALELLVEEMRDRPGPQCGTIAKVAGPEDLPVLIDLVKWPSCSPQDRFAVVEKITRLTGRSFGQDGQKGSFDRWALADWARRHGDHPERSPRRGLLSFGGRHDAEALWAPFGFPYYGYWAMVDEQTQALWDLSAASPEVRREVLERAFADERSAARFLNERGRIVQAAVGFQPAGRSLARAVFRSKCGASSLHSEVYRQACVALIEALPPREIPAEYLAIAKRARGREPAPADSAADATALLSHFWDEDLRWSSSVAGNARRLLDRFAALRREVPPETMEGAARAVFSRIDRPAGCFLADPETLRPIWARLSPAVAAELRARNLKRLLNTAEPSALACLGTALAAWDDLPPGDAAAAWRRLFLFARFQPSPDWESYDRTGWISDGTRRSLAALATRLSPDDAKHAWEGIVRGAASRDPESWRILAASLPALARNLPPSAVAPAGAELLPLIRPRNQDLLPDLLQAVAALGPTLPAPVHRTAVQRFVDAIRPVIQPPACGAVAVAAGRDDLPALVELVQWPACPPEERDALVRKITQLTGTPFGREDGGGAFHFDRWAFADWATRHGFHPEVPPQPRLRPRSLAPG